MKKAILLVCLFLSAAIFANAQFYKSLKQDNSFTDSLSTIVQGFRSNYYFIQGKQLPSDGGTDVYQSTVTMPGAAHCVIQRYHSEEDSTASWQAIMYEGDDYEAAVKMYKSIYGKLKKAKLKFGTNQNGSFSGDLEAPDESVKFTATPLRLTIEDNAYKYFYAEVEITNNYAGWEVHLNLHSKKDDREKY